MRRLLLQLSLLTLALFFAAYDAAAQARPAAFRGDWNYAVYAKDKSELPPAYQSMKLEEVPQYAIDITIRQTGNRLRAKCGIVARYLARVEDCDFTAAVRGGAAQFNLRSSFGGTATVRLTLEGDRLRWKTVRRKGESYYPEEIVLRRLKPGETPPYFEKDDSR
ncbi:MAG TPA: hypothetical protein VJ866_25180 [Pyrinomonadaceae bacterium]|nr:hypothetical protein [Pyrinomonadaceae bacterium]